MNAAEPSRVRGLLSRAARMALEEVRPMLSARALTRLASELLPQQSFNRTRTALLRAAGAQIGEHSLIQGAVHIVGDHNAAAYLSIGPHTIITGPLRLDLAAPIKIGTAVRIGHDVTLLTVSHAIGSKQLRAGNSQAAGIEIGDGAWLASKVTVLPNVRIGEGAIVAAGAVVVRDVPPHTLVAGVPARVVRTLETVTTFGGSATDSGL